jgi:hypothetical protein
MSRNSDVVAHLSNTERRRTVIVRRWLSIIGSGFVGSAVVLLVAFWRQRELAALANLPYWSIGAASVCLVALVVHLGRERWSAFFGIRHLASYPPTFLGALLGTGVTLLAVSYVSELRTNLGIDSEASVALSFLAVLFVGLAPGLGIVAVGYRLHGRMSLPRPAPHASGYSISEISSFDELTAWLVDDKPVKSAVRDLFGHARLANRIVQRFTADRLVPQAIVGKLGAGKTTLRNLAKESIEAHGLASSVSLVPVELWPYETPRAAVEGVLRTLIDAIKEEASVLALRGLSAAYADAMTAAGGWWSALVRTQGVPANPFEALKAIDDVATAIGRRYIVWIDDLERFAGTESEEADERLSSIRALLFGLTELTSVTVITATTDLRMRLDLEKIARFVEELPDLPEAPVSEVLRMFREGCFTMQTFIDPAPADARKPFDELGRTDEDLFSRSSLLGPGAHDVRDALLTLSSTPRALKQALRATLDIWRVLAGEIDLDDVLVLSVLRESHPDVFARMQDPDHLHFLRGGRRLGDDDRKEAKESWNAALETAVASGRERQAVREVIKFCFPEEAHERPQGVRNRRHADYWKRFLTVPGLADNERDQPVLRTLLGNDDDALLALLEDERRSDVVEDFQNVLGVDRLKNLFVPLFTRLSMKDPASWNEEPPGLVPFWRMWLTAYQRQEVSGEETFERLKAAYDISIPINLALASQIEHYFAAASDGVTDSLRHNVGSHRAEAQSYFREKVASAYATQPVALAAGLRGAMPQTLLWCVWNLERVRANRMSGTPFTDWPVLAPVIIDAARIEPLTMLPQLAVLVVREILTHERPRGYQYHFDATSAANLFGDTETVLRLFRGQDEAFWKDVPQVITAIRSAV